MSAIGTATTCTHVSMNTQNLEYTSLLEPKTYVLEHCHLALCAHNIVNVVW